MLISTLILIFPIAMIIAALTDLFTLKIPNKVSFALAMSFFLWAPAIGMSLAEYQMHVALGFLMLIVGIVLFELRIIGGGDAKLLAAGALWMTPSDLPSFLVMTTLAGGLLCLSILIYRSMAPPAFLLRQPWAMRLHEKTTGVPYGIAIAVSGLWLFPTTVWQQATLA